MSKVTVVCKGKAQPSEGAIERFVSIYNRMLKENSERERLLNEEADKENKSVD